MKTAKKVERQLTKSELEETQTLALDSETYRWLLGIRRCGIDGCAWGKLPMHASQRLLFLKLISSDGVRCVAVPEWLQGDK